MRRSGTPDLSSILSPASKILLRNQLVFVFVCFGHFLKASTGCLVMAIMTLNSDLLTLKHAEFCFESAIHDIRCHLSGNRIH